MDVDGAVGDDDAVGPNAAHEFFAGEDASGVFEEECEDFELFAGEVDRA